MGQIITADNKRIDLKKINSLRKIIAEKNHPYLNYHSKRYEELVKHIEQLISQDTRILDIGNSSFAEILSKLFKCKVDELGFAKDSQREFGQQFHFDLNHCHDKSTWRNDIGTYDIILFAEVLEHLYTSPNQVLSYLDILLNKGGKLIIQTPNAAVFHKRIQMLFGKNPYMLISETRKNPGHFREYTKRELVSYARNCGFAIDNIYYGNYFDYQYAFSKAGHRKNESFLKIFNLFYSICPPSFKPGITMILSK